MRRMLGVLLVAAAVVVAGCTAEDVTSGIGADAGSVGVKVDCGSHSIEGTRKNVKPGVQKPENATCDVQIKVYEINTDTPICSELTTIYEGGNSVVPCDAFLDYSSDRQFTVDARFFEPGTSNEVGTASDNVRWNVQSCGARENAECIPADQCGATAESYYVCSDDAEVCCTARN